MSGLSAGQAKQILLRELEDELRHDSARLIRQVEEETRRDADRRARSILAAVMQRVASATRSRRRCRWSSCQSDELKGRIIGREGRNIRALETLTGIDFIIDDTPGAVLLSGFDGVRREIARLTLEQLLQDGRIHPARIEEAFDQAQVRDRPAHRRGGRAGGVRGQRGLAPPGARRSCSAGCSYRTSYGQNVLAPLDRVRPAGGDARGGAGRRPARGRARRAAARHRQGGLARDRGPARAGRRRAGAPLQGVGGGRARDGGAPQRGRDADGRGRDRAGRRRALRRAPGRPRRVARALREAAPRPRGDRLPPRGRREGLRHAGRARDPRDRPARGDRRRRAPRCSRTRSPATSRRSSSTPARSRSR